jgi:phage recombination protein Bet
MENKENFDIQLVDEKENFDIKRNDLRAIVPAKVSNSELKVFYHTCKTYDLDPFNKEIYLVELGGKLTTITSRDGYLKIANRNPMFNGMESDCVYEGDLLVRREDSSICITYSEHHITFDRTKLMGAFANVYRKDRSKSSTIFVSLKDHQKNNKVWDQYANAMILKVAESYALKRAFALSGLVTNEELGIVYNNS